MLKFIALIILFACQAPAFAGSLSTPGAIATFEQIPNTQFQYDPVSDLSVLTRAGQTQFTLSVLPVTEPAFALEEILKAFNAQQHISGIEAETIAGTSAAGVHVKQQTSDWWIVFKGTDLNLFVRVQDATDARSHRKAVATLVKSVRLAPAAHPAIVSGNYTTGSSYSGSYSSGISTFSESSISLQANGSFSSSSYAGVSGANVTGLSEGDGPGGWWQVRGNRILAYEPPDNYYNYRFEAFSNGLEVYTNNNEKLLWVRK